GSVIGKEQSALDIGRGDIVSRESRTPGHVGTEPRRRLAGFYVVNIVVGWKPVVVIGRVKVIADLQLLEIAQTGHVQGLSLRSSKARQKQRRKNGDDSDYDQKLDESEPCGKRRSVTGFQCPVHQWRVASIQGIRHDRGDLVLHLARIGRKSAAKF